MSKPVIVGIDLGTTNSAVAAYTDGGVRLLGTGDERTLPSCVGLTPDGELLIGRAALNQSVVFPERTVSSIKRRMGSPDPVSLGDRALSPPEVSSLILRELVRRARRRLGCPVERAVITVPAYFSDAQRGATREAGALAGLEVVRILNEPTAAALAYLPDTRGHHTVMVYDLGGGTFDVSIVTVEGEVTEVLASHGNNRLGGDDFDELLLGLLAQRFGARYDVDLEEHPAARARLRWAAESAKRRLSAEHSTVVREEGLVIRDGVPLHLEEEVTRAEYEALIGPLVESTFESVTRALGDAGIGPSDLDAVLLVGGSTRTPLVASLLQERTAQEPRRDVDPDLCVALGAGILASRLGGHEVDQVLVDVSPFSFGPSYLGELYGRSYVHCYRPIIERNVPLPVTRTDSYYTAVPFQSGVDIEIYQGDDPDAMKNIPVGHFHVGGLTPAEEQVEVLCRMSLDLDGILRVEAIEKKTGLSKAITIRGATEPKSELEIAAARRRLSELYDQRLGAGPGVIDAEHEDVDAEHEDVDAGPGVIDAEHEEVDAERGEVPAKGTAAGESPEWLAARDEAVELLERSRALLDVMHDEDKEEAIDLHETIHESLDRGDAAGLATASGELSELLFFIEGKAP